MVERLQNCEDKLYETGMFNDVCLLEMDQIEELNSNFVKLVETCI